MTTKTNAVCPCGTEKKFEDCCGLYISGRAFPDHPEALMRSRYTAFTLADVSYLRRTMSGPLLKQFDPESVKAWAQSVTWLGLDVKRSESDGRKGLVEFCARYQENDQPGEIAEVSAFYRSGKQWYYTGKLGA